jgi:ubiquinone/menaquinone biosynthesis C-methylase UbiE
MERDLPLYYRRSHLMNTKDVSPEKIMQLTTSHWSLKALAVAVDLSVFTSIKGRELTATQLGGLLGIPPRPLERLLNANAALGFLDKSGDTYRNTDVAETYLVEKSPNYLGDFIKLAGIYGFAKWTRFKECVVNDTPIEDIDDDFRRSEDRMQYFIRAMHNNAKASAGFLTTIPNLEGRNHLLDLGGGSGAYCIALTEKYPELRATLVDFPPVCKVAVEFIRESRSRDRIKIVEADVLSDEFTMRGDVILLSQVLHGMSMRQCRSLINKCHEWTLPGGIIVIHEFVLDDGKASPLYPALFALNMLISTPEGNAYTKGELTGWLKEAGYSEISYHPTHGPSTFIIGCKVDSYTL